MRHEGKRILLDSAGCALGGLSTAKGKLSVNFAKRLGSPPEATIICRRKKLPRPHAAFVNGELINALDYDAIISVSHIPPFVLPAILAVAEKEGATGRDLILAIAIGHEIAARIATATTGLMEVVPEGPNRGIVTFPVVHEYSGAVFGVGAGAGRLLKLIKEELLHAFGIAGSITPMKSMPKWYNNPPGTLSKCTLAGWVSQPGVSSLYLARMGYTGVKYILEGEDGFWKCSGSKKWGSDKAITDLGKQWHFMDIDYKPYPCCQGMHRGLDCFVKLSKKMTSSRRR